ncbi:hypothetical protein GYMLUDRAFT_495324 [Collybiopsis luxurians FD-317 M1]|uniref:Uncharacterized protein n=1 Tax=Collybiopsis luxurians FD-317 M1 TaxID=944289 RepID=A0A0D0C2K3_9AGAR|nr:hypothetical protein GYMLUDRAFT_495324 [Collybiopsis luxurians FD-317 M1]
MLIFRTSVRHNHSLRFTSAEHSSKARLFEKYASDCHSRRTAIEDVTSHHRTYWNRLDLHSEKIISAFSIFTEEGLPPLLPHNSHWACLVSSSSPGFPFQAYPVSCLALDNSPLKLHPVDTPSLWPLSAVDRVLLGFPPYYFRRPATFLRPGAVN